MRIVPSAQPAAIGSQRPRRRNESSPSKTAAERPESDPERSAGAATNIRPDRWKNHAGLRRFAAIMLQRPAGALNRTRFHRQNGRRFRPARSTDYRGRDDRREFSQPRAPQRPESAERIVNLSRHLSCRTSSCYLPHTGHFAASHLPQTTQSRRTKTLAS
jgi:hypothetical protein